MYDAALDLLAGSRCLGCGLAGRVWCGRCRAENLGGPRIRWPDPTPPGLAPPVAAADYAAGVRALVVAHKERRLLAARSPLAELLALALTSLGAGSQQRLLLVPVPSRPGMARRRGYDPTLALVREAGRRAAATGTPTTVARLLFARDAGADQGGLDAENRRLNVAGTLQVSSRRLRRLCRNWPSEPLRVVVCDDVLTTGWTAREAQRALVAVGLPVHAIAVVAATVRHRATDRGPVRPGSDQWVR